MSAAIVVLVVDDDSFNRQGLCRYLQLHRFEVVEAGDQQTAWGQVQRVQPRAAILDLAIPESPTARARPHEGRGLLLAQQIKAFDPRIAVVLFSAYEDRGLEVAQLIEQGMDGLAYLLKGCPPETLLGALHATLKGHIVIDPEVSQPSRLAHLILARMDPLERAHVEAGLERLARLSQRERTVADYIRRARNTKAIAGALGLAEQTVDNIVSRIYEKLGLHQAGPELRPLVLLVKILQLSDLLQTRLSGFAGYADYLPDESSD
ncbi:MAG: response regulator transcription factor [Anaerolineae bacterium]|nr:response regulator transcription factor [Anaerolineae bacterium]